MCGGCWVLAECRLFTGLMRSYGIMARRLLGLSFIWTGDIYKFHEFVRLLQESNRIDELYTRQSFRVEWIEHLP